MRRKIFTAWMCAIGVVLTLLAGCSASPSLPEVADETSPAPAEAPATDDSEPPPAPTSDDSEPSPTSEAAAERGPIGEGSGGLTRVAPSGLSVEVLESPGPPSSGPLIIVRSPTVGLLSAVDHNGELQRTIGIGSDLVATTGYPDTAVVLVDDQLALVNMRTGDIAAVTTEAVLLPDVLRTGDAGRFAVLVPNTQLSEKFVLIADLANLEFWKVPQEFGDFPAIQGSTLSWRWEGRRYSASLPDMTVSDVVLDIDNEASAQLSPSGTDVVWLDRDSSPFTWRVSSLATAATTELGAFPEMNVFGWVDATRLAISRGEQVMIVDSKAAGEGLDAPAEFVPHRLVDTGRFLINDPTDSGELVVFDTATQAATTYQVPTGADVVTVDAFGASRGAHVVWAMSDAGDGPIRGWWFDRQTGDVGSFLGDVPSATTFVAFSDDERLLFAGEQMSATDVSGGSPVVFSVAGAIVRPANVLRPCVGESIVSYDDAAPEPFLLDSVDAATGVSLGSAVVEVICLTAPPS